MFFKISEICYWFSGNQHHHPQLQVVLLKIAGIYIHKPKKLGHRYSQVRQTVSINKLNFSNL